MSDWPEYKINCPWDYEALKRADKRKAVTLVWRAATRIVAEWEVKEGLILDPLFLVKCWLKGQLEGDDALKALEWAAWATEKAQFQRPFHGGALA